MPNIKLNDDQRRRLAVLGKTLGRKALEEISTAFSPDTILRWARLLAFPEPLARLPYDLAIR